MATDSDLEFAQVVFDAVTSAHNLIKSITDLTAQVPRAFYPVPKEILDALEDVLRHNAMLTQNLYEENQTIKDLVAKALHKPAKD